MKLVKIKNQILSLCLLLTLFACTNVDEELYSQLNNDNFLQSEEEVLSALGASYSGLRKFQDMGNMWTVFCTADEVAIPGRTGGDWAGIF